MTWTLCSIRDPVAALYEMRRVLKPAGEVLFVEHGLSPEPGVARWQHRLTPCWSWFSRGCHLDRKTDDLLRAAGFLETGYMKGPAHTNGWFTNSPICGLLVTRLCCLWRPTKGSA